MGVYSEYLDRQMDFPGLTAERKNQLRRISELRGGRDIIVYAADLGKGQAPVGIIYADLLPIEDQLSNLTGTAIDVILETPGGSGEVAEDIVRILRGKYQDVAFIVPGCAKSAGTIIAMAGDEILMGNVSSLGPIDAQISWQGKNFSADALLEGLEKIKEEVAGSGVLNKAYIPVLQGISPGELQSAQNALDFAKVLVKDWLARFKFGTWDKHSSTGDPVTEDEKKARAEEIATALCDHRHWKTHGRSIKLADLHQMGLRVTDYTDNPALSAAIQRYYTLLQMTFGTTIYKVFETADSQIYRFLLQQVPPPQPSASAEVAVLDVSCVRCKNVSKVQANLGETRPLQEGCHGFPADNKLSCPHCGALIDLTDARRQIEAQSKKPVVS